MRHSSSDCRKIPVKFARKVCTKTSMCTLRRSMILPQVPSVVPGPAAPSESKRSPETNGRLTRYRTRSGDCNLPTLGREKGLPLPLPNALLVGGEKGGELIYTTKGDSRCFPFPRWTRLGSTKARAREGACSRDCRSAKMGPRGFVRGAKRSHCRREA